MYLDHEHRALADALLSAEAIIVLSGYDSPLYDELYAGWDRVGFASYTGQGDGRGHGSGHRTEVLWFNRPLHQHDIFSQAPA